MEKTLNSKIIYEGKILTLTLDEVELQDGSHTYREVVHHNGGVCILAVKNNKIILVKQHRYPNHIDTLEIPAGKLELNEDTAACALRELEEETNNRAKSVKFITKFLPTPGYTSEWLHLYEAYDFEEVDDSLDGDDDEFIDVVYMDLDVAYSKVLSCEINDAKTMIAIMYAYNKKKER